jgi:hypothetical protein
MAAQATGPATPTTTDDHQTALTAFRRSHPVYERTGHLDELRAREYRRLDARGHTYLDHAGGALYADGQVREHLDLLRTEVLGNPHSDNPTSRAATALRSGPAASATPARPRPR